LKALQLTRIEYSRQLLEADPLALAELMSDEELRRFITETVAGIRKDLY
jgi:hypothetical protein